MSVCNYALKTKGSRRVGFCSDAIEKTFLVPHKTFQGTVLKRTKFEEHNNLKDLFHYKGPFVEWKISMDVKGSSWNRRCKKTNFIFKSVWYFVWIDGYCDMFLRI